MSGIPVLISDLAKLLIVAGITTLLCKKLNLPSVIGYITAGFLIGPMVHFLPTISGVADIETWSDIGVIFLMFALGLEFSIHKMVKVGGTGFLTAFVQIFGMVLVGFLAGYLMGWDTMDCIFLGGMLSMSSTMITMKTLEDMGLRGKPFVATAMGTLVIEDIAAIFLMVVLSTIAVSKGFSGLELAFSMGKLLLYLAIWLLLGIFLVPSFLKAAMRLMTNETLLIVSLGMCFGMAILAKFLGFSTELGAFLAGSILAGTIHAERIERLILPCKDLFGAVFFVSVGMMVEPVMLVKYAVPILILTVVSIFGKFIFLTGSMLAAGQRLEDSLEAAAAQTQIGEFSFIIAGVGTSLGVTGHFLYPVIVTVSIITTLTTPLMLHGSGWLNRYCMRNLPKPWLDAMNQYVLERKMVKVRGKEWTKFLEGFLESYLVYTIILIGIILLGARGLLPALKDVMPSLPATIISCGITYIVVLPLLAAMIRFKRRYYTALWLKSLANRVFLMGLVLLRIATATLLLMLPLLLCVHLNPMWLVLVAVPVIALAVRSDKLAGLYLHLEARFLSNLNERILNERFQNRTDETAHIWLNEQLFVAKFSCPEGSGAIGRSLLDLNWGSIHHVKVIKIIRKTKHICLPEGIERMAGGDVLIIMGNEVTLRNFAVITGQNGMLIHEGEWKTITLRLFIESQEHVREADQLFCCAVELDRQSPIVGKNIKDSGIRQDWSALIIGLERNLYPFVDPDPNTILGTGDLLWLLGPQRMGTTLALLELIKPPEQDTVSL